MPRLAWSAAATLGLALASVVVSEWWFWARWRPDDSVPGALLTVLGYAAAVQVVRLVISRAQVSLTGAGSWRRVLLVGALYGWLVEGVIVTTVIDDLPLTLSWTGLAWHALFTVLLGWWWIPRLLAGPLGRSLAGLALVGVGVGTWAAFWRFDQGVQTPVLENALFGLLTTAAFAGGLALWWWARERSTPSVGGSGAALGVLLVLAVLHAVERPLSLIGVGLVGLALVALLYTRPRLAPPPQPAAPAPYRALPRLVVIPIVATATFAAFSLTPEPVPTGWLFVAVTAPLAVVLFALAWWRARRHPVVE